MTVRDAIETAGFAFLAFGCATRPAVEQSRPPLEHTAAVHPTASADTPSQAAQPPPAPQAGCPSPQAAWDEDYELRSLGNSKAVYQTLLEAWREGAKPKRPFSPEEFKQLVCDLMVQDADAVLQHSLSGKVSAPVAARDAGCWQGVHHVVLGSRVWHLARLTDEEFVGVVETRAPAGQDAELGFERFSLEKQGQFLIGKSVSRHLDCPSDAEDRCVSSPNDPEVPVCSGNAAERCRQVGNDSEVLIFDTLSHRKATFAPYERQSEPSVRVNGAVVQLDTDKCHQTFSSSQ